MQALTGLMELMAVASIVVAVTTSVLSGLAYPFCRARLRRLAPGARSRRLLAWAAAPAVASAALTALCLLPSLLTMGGVAADHCFEHVAAAHLCLIHPPSVPSAARSTVMALLGVAILLVAAVVRLRPLLANARLVRALRRTSRHDERLGVDVVDASLPLSLTAGLLRPQVFVSSGLARALPGDLLAAVVAHEHAHAARRDTLRTLLASVLAGLHLPWIRRAILADLSLACEEHCDDVAARCVGSRLSVARAIVAVERLLRGASIPRAAFAPAFAGLHVTARVERLLAEPTAEPRARLGRLPALLAATGIALAGLHPVHHITEALLGLLFAS